MAWPFSLRTTYVPNGVPAVKASDLNALQAEANWQANCQLNGTAIKDDFLGSNLSNTLWVSNTAGVGSSLILADDTATGARGVLRFVTGASGSAAYLQSRELALGGADFRFGARIKRVTFGATAGNFSAGLVGISSTAHNTFFQMGSGGALTYNVAGATSSAGTVGTGSYTDLSITRAAGVVTFRVNGAVVYSGAFGTSVDVQFFVGTTVATAAGEVMVDVVSLHAPR